MLPLPALSTDRLELTPLTLDDAEPMVAVLGDARMYEFTGGEPPDVHELRRRYAVLSTGRSPDGSEWWFNWIVRDRGETAPVGVVQATVAADLSRSWVAWEVGVPWQGAGRASEAAAAMVAWLAEQGVAVIEAAIARDHRASEAVARRLGLQPTDDLDDGEVVWRRTFADAGHGAAGA